MFFSKYFPLVCIKKALKLYIDDLIIIELIMRMMRISYVFYRYNITKAKNLISTHCKLLHL